MDAGLDAAHFTGLQPTVLAMVEPVTLDRTVLRQGIRAALLEDTRWHNCPVKSTSLLGNLLPRRRALDGGAAEALLHRNGELTEGTSSNVFAVLDGRPVGDGVPGLQTRRLIAAFDDLKRAFMEAA